MKKNTTKVLSIILNLALVGTSFADVGMPGVAASAEMPDFAKALVPPSQLGFLDSYYKGQTDKPVILIQDLHANYGVQKKIEGLLEYYQPKVSEGGHSMVLGIEGAWGKLDLTQIRTVAEKPRRAASDFLLKEAEISGMEHYAALTNNPLEFYGIDNPEDYIIHVNLFRKSLAARLLLAGKIDKLRESVNQAKIDGSSSLRHLWKLSDDFHAGKIGLDELSKALKVSVANYGDAEAALSQAQMNAASAEKGDKSFYMKNVVSADQDLELLARLFRQQLTMEEVQYVSGRVPQMLVVIQALIPGENMQLWEDTVRSAIDHYAVALLRNQPMSAHAEELAMNHPDTSVVIVTGGFHTAGIMEDFKAKKISYIVIAPTVESQTAQDERLYIKRMMGIHVTQPEIASAVQTYSSARTVPSVTAYAAVPEVAEGDTSRPVVESAAVEQVVMNAFANGATPEEVTRTLDGSNTSVEAAAAAVDTNVTDEAAKIKAPTTVFQRAIAGMVRLASNFGLMQGAQVTVNTESSANEIQIGEESSVNQAASSKSSDFGIPGKLATTTLVASVLGATNLSGATGHPFVATIQAHATSNPLAFVIAGAIALVGGHYVAYRNSAIYRQRVDAVRGRIAQARAA